MRKPFLEPLAAALLMVPSVAAVHAAKALWHGCPASRFCVWEGPDGTGRVAAYRDGTFDVAGQGLVGGGRSAWNRTGDRWCWLPVSGRAFTGGRLDPGQALTATTVRAAHRPDRHHCVP
ncbi:hypothetical protein GCM10009678_10680 [Actinomadura kijaniata]|uniref:Peptidase inhibitor family I36 n=1 Tax=Actinomadura namibiensis TaxID=182080 RepID=A0A7W3LJ86_ACTNM|nr:peptidase inhibitor family I36 protein [Actinomadura namibiensis]MBA8949192.1 hypothetical protein [Actinomadura namibiensis]